MLAALSASAPCALGAPLALARAPQVAPSGATLELRASFAESPPARPAAWIGSGLPRASLAHAAAVSERTAPALAPDVSAALCWLLRHQEPAGTWSTVRAGSPAPGCFEPELCARAEPALDAAAVEHERPGATALAALALVAAGWVPADEWLLPDGVAPGAAPLHRPGAALERALAYLESGAGGAAPTWSADARAQAAAALGAAALRTSSVRWRSAARRAAGAVRDAEAAGADPLWCALARELCAAVDAPVLAAPVTQGAPGAPGHGGGPQRALAALQAPLRAALDSPARGEGNGASGCAAGASAAARRALGAGTQAGACALAVIALADGDWAARAPSAPWAAAASVPREVAAAEPGALDPRISLEALEAELARIDPQGRGPEVANALPYARLEASIGEQALRAAQLAARRGDVGARALARDRALAAFDRAAGIFEDLARELGSDDPGDAGAADLARGARLAAVRAHLGRALASALEPGGEAARARALAAGAALLDDPALERDPLALRAALALSASALELQGETRAALAEWSLLASFPEAARGDQSGAFACAAAGAAEAWCRGAAFAYGDVPALARLAGPSAGAELLERATTAALAADDDAGRAELAAALAELDPAAALCAEGRRMLAAAEVPEAARARAAAAALAERDATPEALALLRRALPGCAPPAAQELLAAAAEVAHAAGWLEQARVLLDEARALAPLGAAGAELLSRSIELALEAGDLAAAGARLGELLASHPESPPALDAAWFRARLRAAGEPPAEAGAGALAELLAVPDAAPHAPLARVQAVELGGPAVAEGRGWDLARGAPALAARAWAAAARAVAGETELARIEAELDALEHAVTRGASGAPGVDGARAWLEAAPEIAAARAWLALARGDLERARDELERGARVGSGHPRLAAAASALEARLGNAAAGAR